MNARVRATASSLAHLVWRSPAYLLIGLFSLWRLVVSPLYGPTCKYYPSCSAYGLEAVRRHGAVRGLGLTAWRLLRCNPWSAGGIDDVPAARCAHDHAPVADVVHQVPHQVGHCDDQPAISVAGAVGGRTTNGQGA
jgi:putative membrane protein insertion efficiency factor